MSYNKAVITILSLYLLSVVIIITVFGNGDYQYLMQVNDGIVMDLVKYIPNDGTIHTIDTLNKNVFRLINCVSINDSNNTEYMISTLDKRFGYCSCNDIIEIAESKGVSHLIIEVPYIIGYDRYVKYCDGRNVNVIIVNIQHKQPFGVQHLYSDYRTSSYTRNVLNLSMLTYMLLNTSLVCVSVFIYLRSFMFTEMINLNIKHHILMTLFFSMSNMILYNIDYNVHVLYDVTTMIIYNSSYMYSIYLVRKDNTYNIFVTYLLCITLIIIGFITDNTSVIFISDIINILSVIYLDMELDSHIHISFYVVGYFVHMIFFYVSMPILCCVSLVSYIICITINNYDYTSQPDIVELSHSLSDSLETKSCSSSSNELISNISDSRDV